MSPELKGDQKNPSLITLFLKRLSRAIFFKGTHVSRSFPLEINHFTGFSVICMKGKSRRAHKATSIAGQVSLTKMASKRIKLGKVSGPAVRGYEESGTPLVVAPQRGPRSPKHHGKVWGGGGQRCSKISLEEKKKQRDGQRAVTVTENLTACCWWWCTAGCTRRRHRAATCKTSPEVTAEPTWTSVPKNKNKNDQIYKRGQ